MIIAVVIISYIVFRISMEIITGPMHYGTTLPFHRMVCAVFIGSLATFAISLIIAASIAWNKIMHIQ